MPRNHDLFEVNDAVVHLVVELDASLGERHFELSFEGANRCGQLHNFVTGGISHIESFLSRKETVCGRTL